MNTELEYMIQKFLDGETSGREEQVLKKMFEQTGSDEYADVKAYFDFTNQERKKEQIPFDFREFMFSTIDNGVVLHKKPRLKRLLQIAAVVVVLIAGSLFLKFRLSQKPVKQKYTKEELQEGLLNTQKALTLFNEDFQSSFSCLQKAAQISTSVKQVEKIKNIEFTN